MHAFQDELAVVFPGQGAQRKGMGRELFARHPRALRDADEVLGYSLAEAIDSDRLDRTQYTQPALYVVNALAYREWTQAHGRAPAFAAGHSLGEYNALHAAGAFDFQTGLRLVAERGRLMAAASGGRMAAVIGWSEQRLRETLADIGAGEIDIANYNAPEQQVIAGAAEVLPRVSAQLSERGARVVELRVSGAFHSRHMREAAAQYARSLATAAFAPLAFPVVSNVEARPYARGREAELLGAQITASVRWTDSVAYLLDAGVERFEELGPTPTLTRLIEQVRAARPVSQVSKEARLDTAASRFYTAPPAPEPVSAPVAATIQAPSPTSTAASGPHDLGSEVFRRRYGLRYAYVAGAMYKGIASSQVVIRMAKAGMLGFLGTGGLTTARLDEELSAIRTALQPGEAWGANLLASVERPQVEEDTVDLFLRHGVRIVEAAAYTQVTRALARYRIGGLRVRADGGIDFERRVIAKVSRPEVARAFLSPPSPELIADLLRTGAISAEQAQAAARVPMADELCVEADSGGHTDGGVAAVLLPRMLRLRDEYAARFGYAQPIGVGAAGGIGTPEAAASAFVLGADFVVTGSINQCTVEAGTSEAVKDLLATLDVQDVTYAPAGDMFELGARVQVVRKGTLFPARANRLYGLYQHHDSLEALPPAVRRQIEEKYFGRGFDAVWDETRRHYEHADPAVLALAETSPKKRMALVFRWYFVHSNRLAMAGDPQRRSDYQIHCGPALGAFNTWVAGTELADWRHRHVDQIALRLLGDTARFLDGWLARPAAPQALH
ncbi:ACP S-malonyltransferase [Lysobacter sp. TAB13]|uniref:ACP S-malonyltransferase n=1 Tax=Lysobacter sp. TAB13 TaxID=3233065 RepID=UPI003F963DCB